MSLDSFERHRERAHEAQRSGTEDREVYEEAFIKSLALQKVERLHQASPSDAPTVFGLQAELSVCFGIGPLDLRGGDFLNLRILSAIEELIQEGDLTELPPTEDIRPDHIFYSLLRRVVLPDVETVIT